MSRFNKTPFRGHFGARGAGKSLYLEEMGYLEKQMGQLLRLRCRYPWKEAEEMLEELVRMRRMAAQLIGGRIRR